ncbi:DNA breaking-rejoining enzyme, partial [Lentinula raphanica]
RIHWLVILAIFVIVRPWFSWRLASSGGAGQWAVNYIVGCQFRVSGILIGTRPDPEPDVTRRTRALHYPWSLDNSQELKVARAGARIAGAHHCRAIRNPITLSHMTALYLGLNFDTPFHCAVWAVASIAFWGCRRLGELTIPNIKAFNPKLHALHSTPIIFSSKPDGSLRAVSFKIPWTKTTREQGATVIGTAQSDALKIFCPCWALQRYLEVNKSVPQDSSLFAYIDDLGHPQNMTKSAFLNFCSSIWAKVGLDNVQGHSFRIGGAVELLLAGVSPEVVAATGGWTSLAFLLYWRRFEEIIPTHVSKAYNTDQINHLKRSMNDYQKANKISNSLIAACNSGINISDFE